jgi:hypothetical protein
MKFWRYLFLAILALVLVLLDVSFFSNFQIHDGFMLSSFVILIIFSIVDNDNSYLYFACCLIFSLVALSSLEPGLLIINFLILPMVLNWIRHKFFPKPTIYTAILYIFISTMIFNLTALTIGHDFSTQSMVALFYFVGINTVLGFVIHGVYSYFHKRLDSGEIKI